MVTSVLSARLVAHLGNVRSMEASDIDTVLARSHAALHAIANGDPGVFQALFSDTDDVILGNPFGPFAKGRTNVEATLARAAANYREGNFSSIELIAQHVSDTLACFVEVERLRAKVGGSTEPVDVAVRATSVFRREHGAWKLVHRHADPITTQRPAESVISR